jgi:pyruvate formate lyase activating enzyme
MQIKGFIKSSLLEWEGMLSCVVFLPGCNLRCPYCHAADLVLRPEELPDVPLEHVLGHIASSGGWIDGAVVTGGEPTLNGPQLAELLRALRAEQVATMLETNGTRPECLEHLLADGLVDCLSMDVKAPLSADDYSRVAGTAVSIQDVRRSVSLIMASGIQHEFRITLLRGLVGGEQLERLLPDLAGAGTIALQNARTQLCLDTSLRGTRPFLPEEMDRFQSMALGYVPRCIVRGRDRALANQHTATPEAPQERPA